MLAPDSRLLLLDQLAPPPGLRFDAAVATTFTLDLTATLLPALAFTGFHLAEGTSDPIATLESVRNTADLIDVFCQAGAIDVPERAPDLLAFVEPMVHPVRPPQGGLFHPKLWFVRYVGDSGAPSFRLLVLTRNLTMDSSWDLAVRLDSARLTDEPQSRSAALRDLIGSLAARSTQPLAADRVDRIAGLSDQAGRVEWELPEGVDDLDLHLLEPGRDTSVDFAGARHLIVSPFVDDAGLRHIRGRGPLQILSRAEELEKLATATLERLDARVLDDLAVVQRAEGSRLGGQLHAKMYVVEQSREWSRSHVFIGSANATGAAFAVNTEVLVELRGHKKRLGIDQFLGGDGTFTGVTQPFQATGELADADEDPTQRELQNAVRRVATMPYAVQVLTAPDRTGGTYDLRLTSERPFSLEEGWTATAELLTLTDYAANVAPNRALDAVVPSVATADITPFVVIRVESPSGSRTSTVVVAELIDAPADRLDVVLARQIDTPEKFLRFLFFLLSLGNPSALAALAASTAAGGAGGSPFGTGGSGILEMVLGALATRPAALADLDSLVRRLGATEQGRASLPEGFDEFWAAVRQAAGLEGRSA